jgi:integrase
VGREAEHGGVVGLGDRIQVTFQYEGKQRRPTLNWRPSQANLARAAKLRKRILEEIRQNTFSFADHFPDYKFLSKVAVATPGATFAEVAADYLKSIGQKEYATKESYRKIIGGFKDVEDGPPKPFGFWVHQQLTENAAPLGQRALFDVGYRELATFVGSYAFGKNKTHNNKVSVLKKVFEFGYADHHDKANPASQLKMLPVQTVDPDPYTLAEALAIIDDTRKHYGESAANYVELQFFAGPRPSETIALEWPKVDLRAGKFKIDCARVMAKDKDTTKTAKPRTVEACPRVHSLLKRQYALTGPVGKNVFGQEDGSAYHDLQVPWKRWRATHKRLRIRYREPYQARHTSVTWHISIYPSNRLAWVAKQHGHSVQVMLNTYLNWIEGTTDDDIEALKRAFGVAKVLQAVKPTAESTAE